MKYVVFSFFLILGLFYSSRAEVPVTLFQPSLCIFEMTGNVRSEAGGWEGVEGVLVEFISLGLCPSGQTYTDEDGNFSIDVFTDGFVLFSFTKDDFEPVTEFVDTDNPEIPILIDMIPESR